MNDPLALISIPNFEFGMKHVNVLIDIAGFKNRGDQLMLEACIDQVRARLPEATIAIPERAWRDGATWCLQRNILPFSGPAVSFKGGAKNAVKRVAERFLSRSPVRLYPDQIDLVLVSPGFRYGDSFASFFPPTASQNEIRKYRSFRKRGRRIVFLPQAFGPFREQAVRDLARTILPLASLVYAREETSHRFLAEIMPDANNIRICPDFTCLCRPKSGVVRFQTGSYAVIVPNARMMDKTAPSIASAYPMFLEAVCSAISEKGIPVVLLNHEGPADEEILWELNAKFGNRFPVLSGLSGVACKDVIGRSKIVISSRYHGVVSGLTQGVPTLCTSWSHKYEQLLAEHGRPGNALNVRSIPESVAKVLHALDHRDDYASAPGCNDRISKQVLDMWDDVFKTMNPS